VRVVDSVMESDVSSNKVTEIRFELLKYEVKSNELALCKLLEEFRIRIWKGDQGNMQPLFHFLEHGRLSRLAGELPGGTLVRMSEWFEDLKSSWLQKDFGTKTWKEGLDSVRAENRAIFQDLQLRMKKALTSLDFQPLKVKLDGLLKAAQASEDICNEIQAKFNLRNDWGKPISQLANHGNFNKNLRILNSMDQVVEFLSKKDEKLKSPLVTVFKGLCDSDLLTRVGEIHNMVEKLSRGLTDIKANLDIVIKVITGLLRLRRAESGSSSILMPRTASYTKILCFIGIFRTICVEDCATSQIYCDNIDYKKWLVLSEIIRSSVKPQIVSDQILVKPQDKNDQGTLVDKLQNIVARLSSMRLCMRLLAFHWKHDANLRKDDNGIEGLVESLVLPDISSELNEELVGKCQRCLTKYVEECNRIVNLRESDVRKESKQSSTDSKLLEHLIMMESALSTVCSFVDQQVQLCLVVNDYGSRVARARASAAADLSEQNVELLKTCTQNWLARLEKLGNSMSELSEIMELPTESYDLGVVEVNEEFAKTFCPLDEGNQHVEMRGEEVPEVAANPFELLSNTIKTTALKSLKEQCDKLKFVAEDTSGKFKNHDGVNDGVISSVFDIMVDLFDKYRAKQEQWRVRDVAAICALRLAESPSSSKFHGMIGETIIFQKISGCSAVRRVLNMDKANLELLNDLMNPSCVRSSKLSQNSTELQIKQLMEFMVRQDAERIRAEKERRLFCEHQTHIYTQIKSRIVHLEATRQLACKEGNELKQQQMLLACRIERKALEEDCSNLSDVGKQLNVAITFLSNIEEQLGGMDTKLDNIQADIQKIQKQMSLMIGRPVIDVIEDWTREQLEKRLRDNQGKVYVDLQVREPDARGDIKSKKDIHSASLCNRDDKTDFPTISTEFKKFMNESTKNILLLSGVAGSGKSTTLRHLRRYILTEYSAKRAREGKRVVLLPFYLSTLKDPLHSLFEEGAKVAYNISETQVQELKENIKMKDSEIELIFFLDGYDEIRPKEEIVNLFETNKLDQYANLPKLIIAYRCGNLSEPAPVGLTRDAIERRIIPLSDKVRKDYQNQHVAIQWRKRLMNFLHIDNLHLACRPKNIRDWIENVFTAEETANQTDDLRPLLEYFVRFSSVEKEIDGEKETSLKADYKKYCDGLCLKCNSTNGTMKIKIVSWILSLISALYQLNAKSILPECARIIKGKSLWLPEDYEEEFRTQKVLRKLTVTPEVAEVVFEILPTVKRPAHSERQIKATLEKLLGKSKFNLVWGPVEMAINSKGLKTIQKGIEEYFEKKMNEIHVLRDLCDRQLFWTVPDDAPDGIKGMQKLDFYSLITRLSSSSEQLNYNELCLQYGGAIASLIYGHCRKRGRVLEYSADTIEGLMSNNIFFESDRHTLRMLTLALRQPLRRRIQLYTAFIDGFITRADRNLQSRQCSIAPRQRLFECRQFCRRLAVYLTRRGEIKLTRRDNSRIFPEVDESDPFFDQSDIAIHARGAAPIKESSDSIFTQIDSEFLCSRSYRGVHS